MRVLPAILTSAIAAIAVLGCGSSGATNSTDPGAGSGVGAISVEASSLEKAKYVKRAEELCSRVEREYPPALHSYIRQHKNTHQSSGELVAEGVYYVVAPMFEVLIAQLQELGAPNGDKAQVEAFLTAMERATEGLERRNKLSLNGDIEREFAAAHQLAADYGIVNCVS